MQPGTHGRRIITNAGMPLDILVTVETNRPGLHGNQYNLSGYLSRRLTNMPVGERGGKLFGMQLRRDPARCTRS